MFQDSSEQRKIVVVREPDEPKGYSIFSDPKIQKSIFSIFGWKIFFGPKKKTKIFFDQHFRSRKNIFLIWIFISRVKISSGIQKSYLERRAMSATMLKMQFLKGVS